MRTNAEVRVLGQILGDSIKLDQDMDESNNQAEC